MMVSLRGWSRLQRRCMLLTLPTASSNTMPNILIGAGGVGLGLGLGGFRAPGNLDKIDSGCWDSSSLAVIQTAAALWDFMTYLRASQRQKHNELFQEFAQHFWAMYVDCMLSRAHGLGKRGFTTTLSELRVMDSVSWKYPQIAHRIKQSECCLWAQCYA